ncbi:hypothetical protein HBB16_19045 [Pseudonocardia sp. MCCB 268]|nr:hypothetical protein [Pseudonocardia cytotoxica]
MSLTDRSPEHHDELVLPEYGYRSRLPEHHRVVRTIGAGGGSTARLDDGGAQQSSQSADRSPVHSRRRRPDPHEHRRQPGARYHRDESAGGGMKLDRSAPPVALTRLGERSAWTSRRPRRRLRGGQLEHGRRDPLISIRRGHDRDFATGWSVSRCRPAARGGLRPGTRHPGGDRPAALASPRLYYVCWSTSSTT